MAAGKLVFVLGFALFVGVVSSFGRFRTVDSFLARLLARRQPPTPPSTPKCPGCKPDQVFMKYALGLTKPENDSALFDLATASEAYFNLYNVTGDAKLITSQFVRTIILHHLLDLDLCFSTQTMRLIIVGIASDIQDAIDNNPELKQISELPEGARDFKNKVPKLLTTLLMRNIVISFMPKIIDFSFFKKFAKTVERSLVANTNGHVDGFISDIEDFRSNNQPSQCRTLDEISRILKAEIQKFPKTFSDERLSIIARLRQAMDMNEMDMENCPIPVLFDALKPAILDVIEDYKSVGTAGGLSTFLYKYADITPPADQTTPLHPSDLVLPIFKDVLRQWIGDGSLKDFIDRIRNLTPDEIY